MEKELFTELLTLMRDVAANRTRTAAAALEIARSTARDVLELAALATPDDALEVAVIKGARQRAEKILETLGPGDNHAGH